MAEYRSPFTFCICKFTIQTSFTGNVNDHNGIEDIAMRDQFHALVAAIFVLLSLSNICTASHAALITTSVSGDLIFEVLSGEGGASFQEFGFGTPSANSVKSDRDVIFTIELNGSVVGVDPSPIVNAGFFSSGSALDFYNVSSFGGSFFAYSSTLGDNPSVSDLVTFTDVDNSLGFGGSVVEVVAANTWILHLDDAASGLCCDDDDNEMVIKISVDPNGVPDMTPVPLPSTLVFFVLFLSVFLAQGISRLQTN